jgi:hypothetical protein
VQHKLQKLQNSEKKPEKFFTLQNSGFSALIQQKATEIADFLQDI